MKITNLGALVADAFERAMTLSSYGSKPLTVGWWRGEAFVYVWNWRTGEMTWKPFQTTRTMQPAKPMRSWDNVFNSSFLLQKLS